MADPTIALQVQTPNVLNTLGNVANVAQNITGLQQSRMDLQERNNLRQLSSNLKSYQTDDGGLDLNKLVNDATKAAPKLGAQWAGQVASAHAEGIAVNQSLMNLSEQQRQSVGSLILSVADKPLPTQQKIIDSAVQANPQLKTWGDVAIKHLKSSWDQGPDAAKQTAVMIAKGTVQVPTQNQLSTPSYVQTSDAAGNPAQLNVNPMAGGNQVLAGGPKLGVAQNVADLQKEVTNVRQAGDQIPIQRNINQNILKLSKNTTTGPGTQYWQQGLAAAGLGQFGDNYQELGKFLEKQAIQNMQSMGGTPSDARLSAAAAANGSTQFNPGALQMVTKFNDASASALDKYRQGVDKAVANNDFAKLAQFKSQWAKNLDIDVFRVENAIRDKDSMELQRIAHELGPEKMKQLALKRKNLEKLVNGG